jgi:hypothetical protein
MAAWPLKWDSRSIARAERATSNPMWSCSQLREQASNLLSQVPALLQPSTVVQPGIAVPLLLVVSPATGNVLWHFFGLCFCFRLQRRLGTYWGAISGRALKFADQRLIISIFLP